MRAITVITQLLVTIVGIVLCSASMLVLTANSTANGTARVLDVAADRPMFNPGTVLDTSQVTDTRGVRDTAWEDAAAEGRDVLALFYGTGPDDLWNSLTELHPGWYDEPMDATAAPGEGAFYVPVGTSIPVPGGLYLATLTGWFTCTDGVTFNGECSATGPVVPVVLPDAAPVQTVAFTTPRTDQYGAGNGAVCGTDAQCAAWSEAHGEAPTGYAALPHPSCKSHTFTKSERRAARLILARLEAHEPIAEDWTYAGAPRVVGAHNDALLDAAAGASLHGDNWTRSSEARAWLSQVVRTGRG